MSEKDLSILNQQLLSHFNETEVRNAIYYEPLGDKSYWALPLKVGICNLEPYGVDRKEFQGIKKFTNDFLMDYCSEAPTIRKTLKFCSLFNRRYENGTLWLTEKEYKNLRIKNKDDFFKAIDDFNHFFYFNLRLTVGKRRNADTQGIYSFYTDKYYQEYFRNLIKASEISILIITSKIGCDIVNRIYPDLHLEYNGKAVDYNGIRFYSIKHFCYASYADMAEITNEAIEWYDEKRR